MSKSLLARLSFVAACALAWTGCTVKSTDTPELSGPSDFALSFGVTATPDAISQDGGSQSTIVVKAYGPNGDPGKGVTFRLNMSINGTAVDYGELSTKTIVTGNDGRATAMYTAPAALPNGANLPSCAPSMFDQQLPGGCIDIIATPVGGNFNTSRSQTVSIHLVPLGVITPPALTPSASFVFNPSAPSANSPVQFDASASCPGQATATGCVANSGTLTNYAWEFSDGGTAGGRIASHSFALAQTYSATLTVTNDRGVKASTTKSVPVGGASAPTAAFTYSPTPVMVNAQAYFDASASRPGLGHTIVGYTWNWGDGDPVTPSANTPIQQHDYLAAGTYTVVLTVIDDAGTTGTASQSVTVTAGNPVANFTSQVTNAGAHQVTFDSSTSTSSASPSALTYLWDFGDGSPTSALANPVHVFPATNTYVVKLTVTDSNLKSGVLSKNVIVP